MSILIKGMAMPKSCGECPLEQIYGRDGEVAKCPLTEKTFSSYLVSEIRMSDCPLIELPPHGDLIDERWLKDAMATTLEALIKNPKMDAQEMHIIAAFDTLREMIDDAPAIIESEENK